MTTRFGMDSGRLKLQTALKRNDNYEGHFFDTGTKSASLAKAEREIKALKEENTKLRTELEETRSTLHQLVTESSHESFDERRVNLLKCQIIQLERQMLLLSDAIGARTESLMEVENVLCWLADTFRSYITAEVKGPSVPVERRELTRMVESTESARIKLFKNIENCSKQSLSRPLMLLNKFVAPGRDEEVTLLDVALGKLEHVNLKHVAQLESKLSLLYKELIRMHALMEETESANHRLFSCHVTSVVGERLKTQILKSCAMMKGCADDLLALSLLYPSAPWPVLKRPVVEDVSCERFVSCLPPLPRGKSVAVQHCVNALLTTCNYRHHMLDKQIKTLKNEIKFHQKVYDHQVKYMESLFESLRDNYSSFEQSLQDIFITPMRDILDAFTSLEETASEQALKTFLSTFREHRQQFVDAGEKFEKLSENGEGQEAVSGFGVEYFKSLEVLVEKQQRMRDRDTKKDDQLRNEQHRLDDELMALVREMEQVKTDAKERHSKADSSLVANISVISDKTESTSIANGNSDKDVNVLDKKKSKSHIADGGSVNHVSAPSNKKGSQENENMPKISTSGGRRLSSDETKNAALSSVTGRNSFSTLPSKFSVSNEKTKSTNGRHSQQLSYKPNLQVAAGTLQLKRSGSLSQLYSERTQSYAEMVDFRLQSDSPVHLEFDTAAPILPEGKARRTLGTLHKPPFK